jgi:hypothetical protein
VVKGDGKGDGFVIPDKDGGRELVVEVKEDPTIDVVKGDRKGDGFVIPDKDGGRELVVEVKEDPTIDVVTGDRKGDGFVILEKDGGKEVPVEEKADPVIDEVKDGGKEVVVDEKEDPIIEVVKGGVKDPFADFVRDFDVKGGDVVARENTVVKTYGTVLTTTSEEILKLDKEIGVPPLNRSELALFLRVNQEKLAKRDGLVASFEKDLEDFLTIVGKDKLGTNTKGEVGSFIERDLKTIYKNVAHLSVNSDAIITGFANRDDVGLPVKTLVNGLKS